jgi:hypothetical protein
MIEFLQPTPVIGSGEPAVAGRRKLMQPTNQK